MKIKDLHHLPYTEGPTFWAGVVRSPTALLKMMLTFVSSCLLEVHATQYMSRGLISPFVLATVVLRALQVQLAKALTCRFSSPMQLALLRLFQVHIEKCPTRRLLFPLRSLIRRSKGGTRCRLPSVSVFSGFVDLVNLLQEKQLSFEIIRLS